MANTPERKVSFITDLTDSSSEDLEGIGTLRFSGDGNVYRWVKNTNASAVAVGTPVGHDMSDKANYLKYIDLMAAADLGCMAGVVVSTSIPAGGYGWIQVAGVCTSVICSVSTNVTITAGNVLKGADGAAYVVSGTALGTAPIYTRGIIALEDVASATTAATTYIYGDVRCL